MRKNVLRMAGLLGAAALVLVLSGCLSVGGVVGDAVSAGVSNGVSGAAASKTVAVADFKDGEVLAAVSESTPLMENHYMASKVLKPASEATKGQAEILVVGNGEKLWSSFVIPSHKAGEAEIQLGMSLFYHNWAHSEDINPEDYRKMKWFIGTVSNTDEMFKGLVEVNGDRMYLKWLRIPDQPLSN